jgi:hypothetical protein
VNGGADFSDSGVVFEYLPIAAVDQLLPHHGPVTGNTEVMVIGSHFQNTSDLVCKFGSDRGAVVPVYAFINSSHILCRSPVQLRPGPVQVQVSNNGASALSNFSASAVTFNYGPHVTIRSVSPPRGPASGNWSVVVEGEHFGIFVGPDSSQFKPSSDVHCKVGGVIVRGEWLDDSAVQCMTPPHEPGVHTLEVSNNGKDFTRLGNPLLYYVDQQVTELTPVSGPANSAGTRVVVRGAAFLNTSLLLCRFGLAEVPAIYRSSTEIVCESPPLSANVGGLQYSALSEQYHHRLRDHEERFGSDADFEGWSPPYRQDPKWRHRERLFPAAHHYPLYSQRLVSLEVTNNGQDYSDSGMAYLYQADAEVHTITPREGRDSATTPLFITGKHFVNSSKLRCRVGERVVPATFLTSELVLCQAAPQAGALMNHGWFSHGMPRTSDFAHATDAQTHRSPMSVFVEVSNNALDFTVSRALFEYTGCPTGHFCLPQEAGTRFPCPRGTYCPGEGNTNFTLCPRGTYQPKPAQSDCLRCPIGYQCPDVGLFSPRLCPAGFVCDVTGIEVADQPCPDGHFCLEGTATTATTCGSPRLSLSCFLR